MPNLPPHLYGTLITALGVIILSPDGLLIRLISVDSWTTLFWRGLFFASTILTFYILRRGAGALKSFQVMGRRGFLAAACFTVSTIFFVLAVTHTNVANALFIIATAPLFAALLSWIFLGEKIRLPTWIAIVFCLGGIGLIFLDSIGGGSRLGDFYAIICALGLAGQITTVRHARSIDMVPSLALSGYMVAAISLPLATPSAVTSQDIFYLILLGVVILPCAFSLITIGPRFIPAPEVSLLMLLESIFGPLWVWFVIHENPGFGVLTGGAVVITTLFIHSCLGYRKNRRNSPPD